jgi:hypothetical protein
VYRVYTGEGERGPFVIFIRPGGTIWLEIWIAMYRFFTWEIMSLSNSFYLGVFIFREYNMGLLKVRDGDGWRHKI